MLAAWVGVDSRAGSSLYLVSDSRLTLENGRIDDQSKKIFLSLTEPHLFGYAGWSPYPTRVLDALVRSIDNNTLFRPQEKAEARHAKVLTFLQTSLRQFLRPKTRQNCPSPFFIIHAARENSRMNSTFHLWILQWVPGKGWKMRRRHVGPKSAVLCSEGSGKRYFRRRLRLWNRSEVGNTSRAVFSSFCDALRGTRDPSSGGAPQLAGLFRIGSARQFGVLYGTRHFIAGRPTGRVDLAQGLSWRNELFERVDARTSRRVPRGQPQPRPASIGRPRPPKLLFGRTQQH
jgi:hypothetical protein